MAQPNRNDSAFAVAARPTSARLAVTELQAAVDHDYRLGGQVGQMQTDLAYRLSKGTSGQAIQASSDERVVRFLSVTGGYLALMSGYAGLTLLILR